MVGFDVVGCAMSSFSATYRRLPSGATATDPTRPPKVSWRTIVPLLGLRAYTVSPSAIQNSLPSTSGPVSATTWFAVVEQPEVVSRSERGAVTDHRLQHVGRRVQPTGRDIGCDRQCENRDGVVEDEHLLRVRHLWATRHRSVREIDAHEAAGGGRRRIAPHLDRVGERRAGKCDRRCSEVRLKHARGRPTGRARLNRARLWSPSASG